MLTVSASIVIATTTKVTIIAIAATAFIFVVWWWRHFVATCATYVYAICWRRSMPCAVRYAAHCHFCQTTRLQQQQQQNGCAATYPKIKQRCQTNELSTCAPWQHVCHSCTCAHMLATTKTTTRTTIASKGVSGKRQRNRNKSPIKATERQQHN